MKISPYWILPLLFAISAARFFFRRRELKQKRDGLMDDLASKLDDLFPAPPSMACVNLSMEWSREKKEKAAKDVFESLLIALPNPLEFKSCLLGHSVKPLIDKKPYCI
ncbi:hypothetical protein D918_02785 [Trichuris suis]|nr:hypothetical protein D918_02785 [Trichuris suis]